MKQLKPFLKKHDTSGEAYDRTKQKNVIAVEVKTWTVVRHHLANVEFFSYKTKWPYTKDGDLVTLFEDFPLDLGTHQSIEEIDEQTRCRICGGCGPNYCTVEANCLNIPYEAEMKYLSTNKQKSK